MKPLDAARRVPGRGAVWLFISWSCMYRVCLWTFKLLYRVRLLHAERVPREGPLIYVANHQSHLDPPLVGVLVQDRPFASMARSTLFRFRPFASLIRFLGAIPIERGRPDTEAMRLLLAELKAGRCILMFPEGTRTPDGTVQPFRAGLLLLIRRSRAPVVPVAVAGAYDVWSRHRKSPRLRGRVSVMAGEPISADDLLAEGNEGALERLRGVIEGMRQELAGDESD